jgi:hypothetical protein
LGAESGVAGGAGVGGEKGRGKSLRKLVKDEGELRETGYNCYRYGSEKL